MMRFVWLPIPASFGPPLLEFTYRCARIQISRPSLHLSPHPPAAAASLFPPIRFKPELLPLMILLSHRYPTL
jgi:hypothetical protein